MLHTQNSYKPSGGVAAVELYPADADFSIVFGGGGALFEAADEPLRIELIENQSEFEEVLCASPPPISVQHTLTLVTDASLAPQLLSKAWAEQALLVGFVAKITLNDGRTLICGYSESLADEAPLRLHSISYNSGKNPAETPKIKVVLTSLDTEAAAPTPKLKPFRHYEQDTE